MSLPSDGVRIEVLGPVGARVDGTQVDIGGPRQRLVLALLVAAGGALRQTDRLVDDVWAGHPPATARKTLQGYVHHLRRALGQVIATTRGGYRLDLPPGRVDAVRFAELADTGRTSLASDPVDAARTLSSALALWSGPAYADLDDAPALAAEIARLQELRLATLEDRVEADLAGGSTPALVGELQSLVREYPLRERLHRLLMLALYRAGRQADAVSTHERLRRLLADELGLDPAPTTTQVYERVLRQDPTLLVTMAPGGPTHGLHGYELRDVAGEGPLGTVHRAFQTSLGRQVALKVMRPELADDPAFVEEFATAARRIATLDHPRIVPLHDAWRQPGAAHLVMPWFSAGSLDRRISSEPLAIDGVLEVVHEVGGALEHAHRRGISHGRIKPTNVLLDGDERAWLSDFALPTTGARGDAVARGWLAPEVLDGHGASLGATDVHGLATLARALLRGQPGPPGPARDRDDVEALDPEVVAVLVEARSRDPRARPQRIPDLLRALRRALGHDVSPAAVAPAVPPRSELRNPYKGLRAFQESDASDFFGRDDLVDHIDASLGDQPFVTLVGPSGTGKSSVVKAGLLPRLRGNRPAGGPPVLVAEMFPGSHPFEELEAALLRVAVTRPADMAADLVADDRGLLRVAKQVLPDDDATLVLVIDQFEELFSLVGDEQVRRRFVDSLVTAVTAPGRRILVVATLRADFYDRPLQYHQLGALLQAGTVAVTTPSSQELAAAVTGPARRVGLGLEPGLVAEVVAHVVDQPGGLPLLQYTLTELVEQRTADRLTIAAYRVQGGVLGALGRRAELLWDGLGSQGRDAARQVFLRMVTVDEAGDDLRRRVRRSELSALRVTSSTLSRVLTLFGAHRLLSFDRDPVTRGPTVEVAHEALLREWPRLRGWIEEQREDLVLSRRLAVDLAEWEAADRDEGWLLRGDRLARFESWAGDTSLGLTAPERDFLTASRAMRDDEHDQEVRSSRRLRRLLAVVSVLAVTAGVAGVAAWRQADHAAGQTDVAEASRATAETSRLALQAPQLMDSERQVALLLAAEAMHRDPGPDSVGALQSVLVGLRGFLGEATVDTPYHQVVFGHGDEVIGRAGRTIEALPAGSATPSWSIPVVAPEAIAVSDDRELLAVADDSGVNLYDPADGTHLREVDDHPHGTAISMAFDPRNRRLAVGELEGEAWLYDLVSEAEPIEVVAHPEDSMVGIEVPVHRPNLARFGVRALAFDAAGDRLATGGLVVARVWDTTTGERLDEVELTHELSDGNRFPAPVDALAFAPPPSRSGARGDVAAEQLVLASSYNVVRARIGSGVLDLDTELEFPDRANTQGGNLEAVTVELAGDLAVLGERGGEVTVLDLADGTSQRLDAQVSGVPLVAISADGRTLAFSGDEDVVRWSLDGRSLIASALPRDGQSAAELSADGRWLALSTADRRPARIWELSAVDERPGQPPTARRVELPSEPPVHYAMPGVEDWVVTVDLSVPRLHVRRFRSPTQVRALPGGVAMDTGAFSHDGRLFAWASAEANQPPLVHVVDLERNEPVTVPLDDLVGKDNYGVPTMSFSRDDRWLLASGTEGQALVWDTSDWSRRWFADGGGAVMFAAYGPDGRLATQRRDGDVIIRDRDTFQPLGAVLLGQPDGLTTATRGPWFSRDGRWLLTTADGSGRMWDLDARQVVGEPIPTATGTIPAASADARRLVTFDDDQVLLWDLDLDRWPTLACIAAGRNLTVEEWDQFGPRDTAYRRTCPQWPLPHDAPAGSVDADSTVRPTTPPSPRRTTSE